MAKWVTCSDALCLWPPSPSTTQWETPGLISGGVRSKMLAPVLDSEVYTRWTLRSSHHIRRHRGPARLLSLDRTPSPSHQFEHQTVWCWCHDWLGVFSESAMSQVAEGISSFRLASQLQQHLYALWWLGCKQGKESPRFKVTKRSTGHMKGHWLKETSEQKEQSSLLQE